MNLTKRVIGATARLSINGRLRVSIGAGIGRNANLAVNEKGTVTDAVMAGDSENGEYMILTVTTEDGATQQYRDDDVELDPATMQKSPQTEVEDFQQMLSDSLGCDVEVKVLSPEELDEFFNSIGSQQTSGELPDMETLVNNLQTALQQSNQTDEEDVDSDEFEVDEDEFGIDEYEISEEEKFVSFGYPSVFHGSAMGGEDVYTVPVYYSGLTAEQVEQYARNICEISGIPEDVKVVLNYLKMA